MKQKKVVFLHRCLKCCKKFPSKLTYSLHIQRKHFANKVKIKTEKCLVSNKYLDVKVEDPKIEEIFFPEVEIKTEEVESVRKNDFTGNKLRKYKKLNWVNCKFCGRVKRICFYEHHVMTAHKPSTCCLCYETTFSEKHAFKISANSNIINYKCCRCSETFAFISSLNKHLTAHSKETLYACTFCGNKFAFPEALEEHLKVHNDGVHICKICKQICGDVECLQKHILETHTNSEYHMFESGLNGEVPKYWCNFCNKQFKYKRILDIHKVEIHIGTVLWCVFCDKQFKSKNYLHAHITGVHEDMPKLSCKLCNQLFKRKETLSKHISMQHTKTEEQLACCLCNKLFKHKYNLKQHVSRVHKVASEHKCTTCDKQFKYKQSSKIHKDQMHVYSPKVTCEFCNKQFKYKGYLKTHILRLHKANVPEITCNICNKEFKHKNSLRSHIKVHKPNAPKFICPFCNKKYKRKNALNKHLNSMHSETTVVKVSCEICDERFENNRCLRYHHLKEHKEEK